MKLQKGEWLFLLVIVGMVAVSLYAWGRVPERLPVHWGLGGEPDRYGGRLEALGIVPLVSLLIYLLLLVSPRLDAKNRRIVRVSLSATILGLAVLHFGLVATYLGADVAVTRLAGLVVGIVFVSVGNLLPKAQPSRWIGVRTPWTFMSRESWSKTQRAGGWVMTLSGLAFLATALLTASSTALLAVVGATLLALLGVTLHSYLVWRNDVNGGPTERGF